MRRLEAYGRGVSTTVTTAAIPYGYTLTVSTTAALVTSKHHDHDLGHFALFIAGAAAAYGTLRVLSRASPSRAPRGITRHKPFRGGAIHVSAMAAAVVLAWLAVQLPDLIAWLVAPFAATLAYLGITAFEETLTLLRDVEAGEEDT